MIVGVVLDAALGITFVILGLLVWKKEKISLFHDYHVERVSPENRKAFCTMSGIGLLISGTGMLVTAVWLALTDSAAAFIAFGVGFAIGLGLLITAGVRYNR